MTGVRVSATGLTVRIGGVTVLDGVDVELRPATLTAVVGPSGSGKTTLFNVLAELQEPSAGRVEFDGTPIAASSVRIGLVHQAFALLSLLTAAENVELAAQVLGGDGDAIRVSAQSCLAAVNLVDRADHLLEELSGGEQQRVAIARAMITEPQLMLADEPTAQLDHDTRETIVAILRRMADDGATVVVATHDPEVAALCDDVVELNSGRVTIPGRHRIAATSGPSPGPRAGNERR